MTNAEFNKYLKEMQEMSVDTLTNKALEYASEEDRLHNFKVAGVLGNETAIQALGGMMKKHTVSVYDMINSGARYPRELWAEKIKDHINYLYLLWALLNEVEE